MIRGLNWKSGNDLISFKFYSSGEGSQKVKARTQKRYADLCASRGELVEVAIEAVFEPMVQGYIIFPNLISIIERINSSIVSGTTKN